MSAAPCRCRAVSFCENARPREFLSGMPGTSAAIVSDMPKAILATMTTPHQAETIFGGLRATGVAARDISMMIPSRDDAPGSIVDFEVVSVPGLGRFLARGPIVAHLQSKRPGSRPSIAAALIGIGVPETRARHYESRIADGLLLASVCTGERETLWDAVDVLLSAGASDVCFGDSTPAPVAWEA